MRPEWFQLEHFRQRLASLDSLPQFALLGTLSGIITGLIILAFRLAIEWPLMLSLPGGDDENFEALPEVARFLLPVIGALLLGILLRSIDPRHRPVGASHVLERLHFHEGHLSLKNAATQFIAGVVSIGSGQSAGREGPAVHLGAAAVSFLGRILNLPNNSIRILVGCGTAAAISASFNTPIAGVIFAMEVVLMEYTVAGFTPIILAAVSATLVTRVVYGTDPAFIVPQLASETFWDIPLVVLMGLMMGVLAAGYIKLVSSCTHFHQRSILLRSLVSGLLVGLIALAVPEIMGISYDSVNATLAGQLSIQLLLILAVAKLLATAIPLGLGMPIGFIGPTMVIGASAGGAIGLAFSWLLPNQASHEGLYAMLGMAAMMGAVLHAPLAALMALMELTYNANIILPGMLIVVIACITVRTLLHQGSIFQVLLAARDIYLREAPLAQSLSRIGVISVMNRAFICTERNVQLADVKALLNDDPEWIVLLQERKPVSLLPAADLARHLDSLDLSPTEPLVEEETADEKLDLLNIPARRRDLTAIHRQATLQEALATLHRSGVEALYVERIHAPLINSVMGIITRDALENYYLTQ